jgi:hypothetical protein
VEVTRFLGKDQSYLSFKAFELVSQGESGTRMPNCAAMSIEAPRVSTHRSTPYPNVVNN